LKIELAIRGWAARVGHPSLRAAAPELESLPVSFTIDGKRLDDRDSDDG
jgi:hypothetical protein